MAAAPNTPIPERGRSAAAAPAVPDGAGRRRDPSRFSKKERLVLLTAAAVVVVGTTVAALNPDLSAAAGAPANSGAATSATVGAHSATHSVDATAPTAPVATAVSVAATASISASATPSAAATRTVTVKAVAKPAATPAPALVTIGTLVNFGSYGGAPLRWRVLYADDDELLLLSEYVLSAGAFQSDWEGTDASRYGASEVRAWLLGDFATKAFGTRQTTALLPHTGGAAGSDRVFLLSVAEVQRYLPKAATRKAAPHAAAGAGTVGFSGEALSLSGAYASWWLVDAASDHFAARVVTPNGKLGSRLVYYADLGVRPAIRVNRAKIAYTLDASGGD